MVAVKEDFCQAFIIGKFPDRRVRAPDVGRINRLAAVFWCAVTPFHIVEVARCADRLFEGTTLVTLGPCFAKSL